jgi:hypothetical protein
MNVDSKMRREVLEGIGAESIPTGHVGKGLHNAISTLASDLSIESGGNFDGN